MCLRYYRQLLILLFSCLVTLLVRSDVFDYGALGAISENDSLKVMKWNGDLLNKTVNTLQAGDTLLVPNSTFFLIGGIKARGLRNVTFQIDGTLSFSDDRDTWPVNDDGVVEECICMKGLLDVVFTSSGTGTLDGNGKKWWGSIDYLKSQGNRPRLLHLNVSKNILVEKLLFRNSPFWSFYAQHSRGLVVRHTDVSARWTDEDEHTALDMQAFNTDGFDVTGKDVHIHDCNIWNQDDCIAVKDNSADMLFERISCSGLGLVIGSFKEATIRNITFRDCVMPRTVKGIYIKTQWSDLGPVGINASITNILYQNITMDRPQQYPIWIGPAQQTGQPCDLLWPQADKAQCLMSGYQTWSNIVLRDIFINNPDNSPGVLMGNSSNPMTNVIFDNVVVTSPGEKPFGPNFFCDGMQGVATGGTSPVPPCFAVQ